MSTWCGKRMRMPPCVPGSTHLCHWCVGSDAHIPVVFKHCVWSGYSVCWCMTAYRIYDSLTATHAPLPALVLPCSVSQVHDLSACWMQFVASGIFNDAGASNQQQRLARLGQDRASTIVEKTPYLRESVGHALDSQHLACLP